MSLGLSSSQFYDLAPIEFYHAMGAFRDVEEARRRQAYEIARFEAVLIINPQLKKPIVDPGDYVKFPWETENGKNTPLKKPQSAEQMKASLFAALNIKQ